MRQASIVLLMTVLVLMAVACGQQESETTQVVSSAVVYHSIEEARAAVGESGRPIIVDFYSEM